jgi:hypothetical protein
MTPYWNPWHGVESLTSNRIVESFTHFFFGPRFVVCPALTFECVENGNPRSNPTGFIMPDGALLNFEKLTAEEWIRLSLCDAIV